MAMIWRELLVAVGSATQADRIYTIDKMQSRGRPHKVHRVHIVLLRDDKTDRNYQPDDSEQQNRADDLIA